MKLSEMKRLLDERELRLTRSLGQNFLHDGNQLSRIVRLAELTPQDRVLEVGPGLGVLTERLLDAATEVWAIEKDRRLVDFLEERFAAAGHLRLIHADALRFLRESREDFSAWKLVSNLPYVVASPILVELALAPQGPERLVVTVQQEVGQRLAASPGTADYGILTLLVQLRYRPQGSFRIPASCFFPAPQVGSACVALQRQTNLSLSPQQVRLFTQLVKRSFAQRRKMMFKLLKSVWAEPALAQAFHMLGLPLTIRAEQVSLDQFVALTHALSQPNPAAP